MGRPYQLLRGSGPRSPGQSGFLKGGLEVYVKLPSFNTLVNKFKNVKILVGPNKTNPQAVGLERPPHAFRRPGLPKPELHEQWTPSPQTGALDRGSVRLTLRQDTAPTHTLSMQSFGTPDNPYVPPYSRTPTAPPSSSSCFSFCSKRSPRASSTLSMF